jgi:hypothetical protein
MRVLARRTVLAAVACATALTARSAAAQLGGVNPFSFGVTGGASLPVGDFADAVNTGYNVGAFVGVRVPTSPVSFRLEGGYERYELKGGTIDDEDIGPVSASGNVRIFSGVANVVLSFAGGGASPVAPYLIGGVGLYNIGGSVRFSAGGVSQTESGSETEFGLNGGLGVNLPLSGIGAFGEVRFQTIFTEGGRTTMIPIKVGIRF